MELNEGLSLVQFKYGASILQCTDTILPHSHNSRENAFEDFIIKEKGKLERDAYPHKWDTLDWKMYGSLNTARRKFLDVAKELHVS
ncbi:MAG: hypothetical protein PVF58_22200 [Candidatus Methanofastidiosia archaeon]|jgi:hypothetical protein